MMTKKETPKIRMMRLTWALPVLALLLVAFAQPNIRQSLPGEDMSQGSAIRVNPADEVTISGEVVRPDGKPLPGASVVIGGTVQGTLSDKDGYFELRIPENQTLNLVVSYVGFESKVTRIDTPSKNIRLKIEMKEAIFNIGPPSGKVAPPPPPPPPSDPVKADAPVLKEASSHAKEVVFIVVEELPQYPGGEHDLQQYITEMQQKLVQAKGIHGKVSVEFTVDNEGNAVNPVIRTKDNEQVGLAALEIVNNMQQWKPGKQRGKPVPVKFLLPVEF